MKKQASRLSDWPAFIHGAPGRIRTADTGFRRAVLYPLSYEGMEEDFSTLALLALVGLL